MNSKEYGSKNTLAVAVAGGLIVMLVLVLGTIWMGQNARRDTETGKRFVKDKFIQA